MPATSTAPANDLGMEVGDHVCGFYWGVAGRDAIMLPFLQSGLRAGDACICVVHATDPSVVLDSLGPEIDVHAWVASHQLIVQSASESYLRDGSFSATGMIAFFDELVGSVTANGATARLAGEGAWALEGHPGVENLIDYEAELNRLVTRHRQMILCLYDLDLFGGSMMVDLLKTHPKILLGGMLIENPHYLTPDEYLRPDAAMSKPSSSSALRERRAEAAIRAMKDGLT